MKKIKNNSKKKKDKKSRKKEETKLEEEVKEAEKSITHRLRETQNDEEKEIEQNSESEQEFFEEPIRQIPISTSGAPVLERIIEREIPNPVIEQPIQAREETNERRIEYSATTDTNYGFETRRENSDEKKYESSFVPPVLSRREELNAVRPEFLRPQTETWTPTRTNNDEFIESEFIEEERKLPFEERKKYKRTKL